MPLFDNLISRAEAARRLNVTRQRVHQFIRDGRLAIYVSIGGRQMLLATDVDAFAKRKRKNGPPFRQLQNP